MIRKDLKEASHNMKDHTTERKNNKGPFAWIIVVIIIIVAAALIWVIYTKVTDDTSVKKPMIKEGRQDYRLDKVILEQDGLRGLTEQLKNSDGYPEKAVVAYLGATITEKGEIRGFTLTLQGFNSQNQYTGNLSYVYDSDNHTLDFSKREETGLPTYYDENADIAYLDTQIRRIPFEDEIRLLDFPSYQVEFHKDTQLPEAHAVMDGRDGREFPLLSYEDYQQGIAGASDGRSAVVISLTDGTGATGQRIEYYCEAADTAALTGHPETTMQTDYRFNNWELFLTDDAGETWVSTGISKPALEETLTTYQNGNFLPDGSFYADGNGMFAVFYGAVPTLRISRDDGASWMDIPFTSGMARIPNRRIVDFLDAQIGYAAIGTDWSMGTGSSCYLYWTYDGGNTWEERVVPAEDGMMLTGAAFADRQNGVLSLESINQDPWPVLLLTTDGGVSYTPVSLPWDAAAGGDIYYKKIDSLTLEDGVYTLIIGQGSGNRKVKFTSTSLGDGWTYQEEYTGTVHTEG